MQFSSRTLLVGVAAVALAIALLRALTGWIDPFDDRRFVSTDWRSSPPNVRAQMSRDLLRNHFPTGTAKASVIAILGDPGEIYTRAMGAGSYRVIGHETYSYYIGSWSAYGYDDAFVYIHFDSTGKTIDTEITGY